MRITAALVAFSALSGVAWADVITLGGVISQSTQDGTGPALNNPLLNRIANGDAWSLELRFDGSIGGPGNYNALVNAGPVFSDAMAAASESGFGSLTLVVAESAGMAQLSLFGCLNSGSGCAAGNQLTASFQIALPDLQALDVMTTGLDQPHPLDLLEDDGTTDVQGSITRYSYTARTNAVAEPSTLGLLGASVFGFVPWRRRAHATCT